MREFDDADACSLSATDSYYRVRLDGLDIRFHYFLLALMSELVAL